MNWLFTPLFFDFEVTNLCNTRCAFCPREAIKRPQGQMSEQTFDSFVIKLKRFVDKTEGSDLYLHQEEIPTYVDIANRKHVTVNFSGMGECLTHKHTADWVRRIRSDLGVACCIQTNGALLDDEMIRNLAHADISRIIISVSGVDRASYERYMKLDWEVALDNVMRSHHMLPGRVFVTVTIPRNANFKAEDAIAFWAERGIGAVCLPCHNRGGFLQNKEMLTGRPPTVTPFCRVFANINFIAWDGRVLSCCHDLRGENVAGSLHTDEIHEICKRKTASIENHTKFDICKQCDDPVCASFPGILMMKEEDLL